MKDTDATWKGSKADTPVRKQPRGAVPDAAEASASTTHGPYIQRIQNDAREDEMEDNMQAVGNVLGNLKNMAKDMGSEIERQNKQIDRINDKVTRVDFFSFDILCSLFC